MPDKAFLSGSEANYKQVKPKALKTVSKNDPEKLLERASRLIQQHNKNEVKPSQKEVDLKTTEVLFDRADALI